MKKPVLVALLLLPALHLYAPPNCEIYKNDKNCYRSCQEAMKAIRNPQGSATSQKHFDKSIELCPDFAYAYMEKAVPYLKRGKFITWKKLIDKAVELDPEEYLGYRGWCRLQFLRDYEGAIKDIEKLKNLVDYDIGYCQTGDYHLNVALGLCYKEIGQLEQAKTTIESQIQSKTAPVGPYDYYHLGVIAYESGAYEAAIAYMQKQIEENDYMGETYYFLALANKGLGREKAYLANLEKARAYYEAGNYRTDTYTEPIDKVYLLDILKELDKATEGNSWKAPG